MSKKTKQSKRKEKLQRKPTQAREDYTGGGAFSFLGKVIIGMMLCGIIAVAGCAIVAGLVIAFIGTLDREKAVTGRETPGNRHTETRAEDYFEALNKVERKGRITQPRDHTESRAKTVDRRLEQREARAARVQRAAAKRETREREAFSRQWPGRANPKDANVRISITRRVEETPTKKVEKKETVEP